MPVSVEEHTSTIPVVLLGSTGSIGTQAREVIEANRGRFDVLGLSAGGASITELAVQIVALNPAYVGVARDVREELSAAVEQMGGTCPEVFVGENASVEVVCACVERAAQLYPRATPVVLNGITVRGSIVGTRLDLQESLDFAAMGKVAATVATDRLENINDVFARMHAGAIEGRVVLDFAA